MIKSSTVGFWLFTGMLIVFFVLPDPAGLQKPFRIFLGLSFAAIYCAMLIKGEISHKTLIPIASGGFIILLSLLRGTFQIPLINSYLCLIGLLCLPHLFFELTPIRKTNLTYLLILAILSMLIQFLIVRTPDGRPSLTYQLNTAGAYLFLFFIFSDVIQNKYGKLFVIALSLLILSRLLVFSILIFYLVRYFKSYFKIILEKINAITIIMLGYLCIIFFSLWYTVNMKPELIDNPKISRLSEFNDESNKGRFRANTIFLMAFYNDPLNKNFLLGFGPAEQYIRQSKGAFIMIHNELFDAISQFGLISVLIFSLFSLPFFNKVTTYANLEFLIPVLFSTLLLWVRYLIIPSFEMIFILFLLHLTHQKTSPFDSAITIEGPPHEAPKTADGQTPKALDYLRYVKSSSMESLLDL